VRDLVWSYGWEEKENLRWIRKYFDGETAWLLTRIL